MAPRAPSGPLDQQALHRFALSYVGRYATTRAKLAAYLNRKLRERGWSEDGPAPVDIIVEQCAAAGYVDDAAFAEARSVALTRRGYGDRRIAAALSGAGIDSAITTALKHDEDAALAAAETFARRRRIGIFSVRPADESTRRRALAAMLRAGHPFHLARRFVDALPEN
jgi:regulatory protein